MNKDTMWFLVGIISFVIAVAIVPWAGKADEFHICKNEKGKVKISGNPPKKPCKGQYTYFDTDLVVWNNTTIWLMIMYIEDELIPFMVETRARLELLENGTTSFKTVAPPLLELE